MDAQPKCIPGAVRCLPSRARRQLPASRARARCSVIVSKTAVPRSSCFRLFRWIDEFVTAWDTVRSNSSGAMYLFSSIRAITIGTFILMNNLFWALNWKLLRFTSAANMKNWASYVRLVAESSGFIWMLLKYSEASNKRAKAVKNLDVKGAAAATEAKTAAVYRAIVFFCNFSTYSDISGLYPATIGGGKAMSQVVFGVLGTISALCGMRCANLQAVAGIRLLVGLTRARPSELVRAVRQGTVDEIRSKGLSTCSGESAACGACSMQLVVWQSFEYCTRPNFSTLHFLHYAPTSARSFASESSPVSFTRAVNFESGS